MDNLWKSRPSQLVQITHPKVYTQTYKYKEEGGYSITIRP